MQQALLSHAWHMYIIMHCAYNNYYATAYEAVPICVINFVYFNRERVLPSGDLCIPTSRKL
jgi:hypothetical protein